MCTTRSRHLPQGRPFQPLRPWGPSPNSSGPAAGRVQTEVRTFCTPTACGHISPGQPPWENCRAIPTRPAGAGAVASVPKVTLVECHLIALQQRPEFCLKGFALVMLLLPADVGFQPGYPGLTHRKGCITRLPMERRKLRSLGFQPLGRTAFDFHHHLGQRLVLAEVQAFPGRRSACPGLVCCALSARAPWTVGAQRECPTPVVPETGPHWCIQADTIVHARHGWGIRDDRRSSSSGGVLPRRD